MKKLITTDNATHLEQLLGETVTLFCCRYIYSGKLISVDDFSVRLSAAGIVYDTGSLDSSAWSSREALPRDWNIALSAIESFGILK